jgi:hypothetical protein
MLRLGARKSPIAARLLTRISPQEARRNEPALDGAGVAME